MSTAGILIVRRGVLKDSIVLLGWRDHELARVIVIITSIAGVRGVFLRSSAGSIRNRIVARVVEVRCAREVQRVLREIRNCTGDVIRARDGRSRSVNDTVHIRGGRGRAR